MKIIRGVMTMEWAAQMGLGPRTVALSLKVFIVVMFYNHALLGICTAQPLPDDIKQMWGHFCTSGTSTCNDYTANCGRGLNILSAHICTTNCSFKCKRSRQDTDCNQFEVCGHNDTATANVCRNGNNVMICMTADSSEPSFCICRDMSRNSPYTRCDEPSTVSMTMSPLPTTVADQTSVAIVLGSLFALLLILVIIGAVIFGLRRQGRLPSFMKPASNPAEVSSVPLEARNSKRTLPPEPTVPGSSMEYSYAYDHRPAKPGAKELVSNQDDHTYYCVGEGGYKEGNPRYVPDWQRKIPTTKELDTEYAKDHPYFVVNRSDEDNEVGSETGGGRADKVELTNSTTEVEAQETNDEDYTQLSPTGNLKSQTEQVGHEVETHTSANESDVTSPIDLPTEGLSNEDDGTYFPLIRTATTKSPLKQSGYEEAKIPTSESHDATSPTGVQSISYDNNTYTPLVKTAEPKSQKEQSGYEAAIISNPGLAAADDDTSPYDHLDRKEKIELKEGALSTSDVDDYQQLANN